MRKHLSSGAPLSLLYGVKPDGTAFTADDLKRFDKQAQRARKEFGFGKKGVRIDQLISASRTDDIERSRKQIRNATFYRIFNSKSGVLLHFRTSAGPDSKFTHHQVKIRLEEWGDWLTSTVKFNKAAKNILNGRISFDCDCGRHQFWYRYVATIGGFAVSPLEHSYPKIRNPKLTGACCKHVLKVLATLRGPAVQRLIIAEMEKEAERIGFGDDRSTANRFLTKKELATAARSSAAVQAADRKKAAKAFQDYRQAKKGFRKKMEEPRTVDAFKKLEKEKAASDLKAATIEKIARHEQQRADRAERDALLGNLQGHMALSVYRDKMSKAEAIKSFAKAKDMPVADVEKLAESVNI
ncbi:hypothetical protein DSCA_30270 [Desulfosarcina alkanivorans]|uniref:SWIM-type domain-containing protein n=1 Tax=Desulfosarcina alkanivorans TaxID=571177 RepID=A0A5K7YWN7_9BACT|nr:hypothetical protein [Desulfosarcina alkanivorans]BBO69097.1 hypothetical protein DSCA_30270 [Desulfosarcina alkanivorans]